MITSRSAATSNRRRTRRRMSSHWPGLAPSIETSSCGARKWIVTSAPAHQRRYIVSSTSSRPGMARARKNPKRLAQSKGSRTARRNADEGRWTLRSALGARPYRACTTAWKRRTLPKPAAYAMSVSGIVVSSIRRLANCMRKVCAIRTGGAPKCSTNSRQRWRPVTPRRSAKSSTLPVSRAPPSISRRPRATVCEVPSQGVVPGAVSGRQRRQGRKPAASAAYAEP